MQKLTQKAFAQKLEMCETSYTEKMQNMHMSLEEKTAAEVSARVKTRLLDAVHAHYKKAQARTVMRSFSQWRQLVVLDKSSTMFLEVVVSSHLIPFHLIFSQRTLSLLTLSHFIAPYAIIVSCSFPFVSNMDCRILS
jgi:hypothetical protein